MFFKEGEIRPFVLNNYVQYGKILKVDKENETYLMEEIKTKKQYVVDEEDVYIGDD